MRYSETSSRHDLLIHIKQSLPLVLGGGALTLLLGIAAAFGSAHAARVNSSKYLGVVTLMPIGTAYDAAAAQLRNAGLPMTLPRDCPRDCMLIFDINDRWLYKLHLAPPAEFIGRLDFRDGRLFYKSTTMGGKMCCSAAVLESALKSSRTTANVDASGRPLTITVELSALDFTEYRKQAYAFDLACIGSMRGCTTEEYLPTVKELEHATPK